MKQFSTKEVFSIPNLMGYFRILLIPLFCYLYIAKEAYLWASIVVLVSSLTDLFDGLIARKFHMITQLGKALDPIADKLTHAALAICLAIRYPYMWWLIGLMIVKEGYMGIMGLIFCGKEDARRCNVVWKNMYCYTVYWVNAAIFISKPAFTSCKRTHNFDGGCHAVHFTHVYSSV